MFRHTQHIETDCIANAIADIVSDVSKRHQQHKSPKSERAVHASALVLGIIAADFAKVILQALVPSRAHIANEAGGVERKLSLATRVKVDDTGEVA